MKLIDHLNSVISENASYVQAYLAKEDLTRVEKLRALANSSDDVQSMEKDGLYINWTKDDMRTHELSEPLKALIKAIFEYENGGANAELDAKIMDIWAGFHTLRLKVLVHCL